MFVCVQCGKTTEPHEKMIRKVVKRLPKTYYWNGQVIGIGWEIAKEISICQECGG